MLVPDVSFIVPVFNGATTLAASLSSIRIAGAPRWECVVVDDGSRDESVRVAMDFVNADSRFRLLRHEVNGGVGAARATGLAEARGEAVHFLDQDDRLVAGGIGRLLKTLRGQPDAGAAFGNFKAVSPLTGMRYEWETPAERLRFPDLIRGAPFPALVVLHSREGVLSVGGMAQDVDGCDEWDLWGRLTRSGRPMVHVDADVGEYHLHAANASRNAALLLRSGLRVIRVLHGPDPRVPSPEPAWSAGSPRSGLAEAQTRFFWQQTANALARGDVDAATELVDILDGEGQTSDLTTNSIAELHAGMRYGRMLCGAEVSSYWLELEPLLKAYLERMEGRLGRVGFAAEALSRLQQVYITSLVDDNHRLRGLVHSYRTSRSYRFGRALTRIARAALKAVR